MEALNRPASPLAADMLDGARAIARYCGISKRRVLYLTETQRLPVFRLGRRLHARKSELDAALRANGRAAG